MHSLSQRASTLCSYVTSALLAVYILVSIITLASTPGTVDSVKFKAAKPIVSIKNTRNYGGTKNTPKENARFKFDLVADFSNVVDWNTKQIFTYIYVELDDEHNETESKIQNNKLIIWDKILTDKSSMYINYRNLKSKYSIWDYEAQLAGRTGKFKLGYNVQPQFGPLTFGDVDLEERFIFPEPKTITA
ncbi:hypothetical protein CANINC_004448 [Pichia inconspicua]|uniref:Signal peptidase subunit 3 n=1 Tax=Pichia inconspicua TaxID=52247 RepID=A0A4T0WVB2_9ASCO|nr:hypothetical protein CANINC_004448 [[Candida] inconspicua]